MKPASSGTTIGQGSSEDKDCGEPRGPGGKRGGIMRINALCVAVGLVSLAAACSPDEGPLTLDELRDEQAVTVDRAGAVDPVVQVSGPSTVYVVQNERLRILIDWPYEASGAITVPLQRMDDGSGSLTYGTYPDRVVDEPDSDWNVLACVHCVTNADGVRCCSPP